MKLEPGTLIAGKYRLVRPLASGGMGSVWIAEHADLEVEVAIKFMAERALVQDMSRARFKREARAAAKLKSPHVTHIHDYGIFEETPYIAMELLEGEGLEQRMERTTIVPLAEVVEIVTQLCRGLKLAHDTGIIHRDLKPSNVFIAKSGDHEVVKILDFGVAKERDPRLVVAEETATGALVGSPRYMSPEQATGGELDHRTDLWSLGVLVYEMLTGVRPFDQQHLGQLIGAICTADVVPPSKRLPTLTPAVDEFFVHALARRPDDRFQSASDMARALAAAAGRRIAESSSGSTPLGRLEATSEMPAESVALEPTMQAAPVAAPARTAARDDGTSPGVGLDSSASERQSARSKRWLVAAALVVVAGVSGGVMLRRSATTPVSTEAPTSEPATLPDPDPNPDPDPEPAAAQTSEPATQTSASSAPSASAPKTPVSRAPPVKPRAASSVKIETEFGLPVRNK